MSTALKVEFQYRVNVALGALGIGALFVGILSLALPAPPLYDAAQTEVAGRLSVAAVLLDRGSPIYPLTIQNAMWLIFFLGLGELWMRFAAGSYEVRMLQESLLPEDEETMLRAKDLTPLYRRLKSSPGIERRFLPRLIRRVILQFQSSRSIDQANVLLNSSLDLLQHEIDLKYNMLRYIMWLIPTLGFVGTVVGIALALADASAMPDITDSAAIKAWVATLTSSLGVAFNTTLLALLMAAALVFLMHIAQGREEAALNNSGQYCLDNLINRLYEN